MKLKQLEINTRLWHIQSACEKVLRITAGKTAEEYALDDMTPDVVRALLASPDEPA
jgi:hypothetical protein